MTKKSTTPATLKSWDRRPWPKRGNKSAQTLFAAIGRALTAWEYHETGLSELFSILVTGKERSKVARRSFSAIRTFEGRIEMLKAASQAYFAEHPNAEIQEQFKELIKKSASVGPRRNEIAHGIVAGFWKGPDRKVFARVRGAYGLYPSFANYKNRQLDQAPAYCYSSKEVDYFTSFFMELDFSVGYISAGLLKERAKESPQEPSS